MTDYNAYTLEELQAELNKAQNMLSEVEDERTFMGKQTGMHISAKEFAKFDREIAKYQEQIAQLEKEITQKKG